MWRGPSWIRTRIPRPLKANGSEQHVLLIASSASTIIRKNEGQRGTIQQTPISSIRDRNSVLGLLVPKILGIVCVRGQKLHGFGVCSVRLNDTIVLSASRMDAHRLMASVYDGPEPDIIKVLSLHLTDFPSATDPNFYRYRGGSVGILGWRRGKWEDAIMSDRAASLSISEALSSGLPAEARD
jgi:hypothetical protein